MRIDLLQVRFLQTENNLARYDPLVLWVPAEEAESTSGGLAVVELEVGVEGKGGSVLEEVGLDGDAVGTGRLHQAWKSQRRVGGNLVDSVSQETKRTSGTVKKGRKDKPSR
jgi:hypothetical protein